jgi:hypothetical protein
MSYQKAILYFWQVRVYKYTNIDPLEFIAREKGKPYILVLYSVASEIIVFEAHKWTIRPSCLAF